MCVVKFNIHFLSIMRGHLVYIFLSSVTVVVVTPCLRATTVVVVNKYLGRVQAGTGTGLLTSQNVSCFSRRCRFGLKTTFIDEGTFKARVLAYDEEFPIPDTVDFSSIPVPVSVVIPRIIALQGLVTISISALSFRFSYFDVALRSRIREPREFYVSARSLDWVYRRIHSM